MEQRFDLRTASDREQLASYLPTFDARTIGIPTEPFVQGLAFVAEYLGAPDWLTYQWGIVGPLRSGKRLFHVDLERLVLLGHELHSISAFPGFSSFMRSFSNVTQFHDSLFEAEVGSLLARLNATSAMNLSPQHRVRGHLKRPEFDVETTVGAVSVECKQRDPGTHAMSERIRKISDCLADAMDSASWPDDLRLEVEILSPLRKQPLDFARELVQLALEATIGSVVEVTSARAFLVQRDSPFRIERMQIGHDRMNAPHGVSTSLFNPAVTSLRVAFNGGDRNMVSVIGAQIRKAIRQLPDNRLGLIFLGDVPLQVAHQAIESRLDLPPYDHVLAFGVVDGKETHFLFREPRRAALDTLFGSGMRPLFTV